MNPYEAKPRPYLRAVVWSLVVFAASGVWYKRDALRAEVARRKAAFVAEMEKVQQGTKPAGDGSGPAANAAAPAPAGPVELFPAPPSGGFPAPAPAASLPDGGAGTPLPSREAAPAAAAVTRRPPPPPGEPQPMYRRVYGVVYDMATALPINGAHLKFDGPNGMLWSATTGPDGVYFVDVSATAMDARFLAEASAPGYREGQLEDADPPYFERTKAKRLEAMSELAPSDLEAAPVRCRPSDRLVPFDLVLIPETSVR